MLKFEETCAAANVTIEAMQTVKTKLSHTRNWRNQFQNSFHVMKAWKRENTITIVEKGNDGQGDKKNPLFLLQLSPSHTKKFKQTGGHD